MGDHSLGNSGSSLHNGHSTRTLHQQRSIGSSGSRDSARMFLTRKSDKIPHYLRASTGSCHDMCKFGHHEEMRKPLRETWPRSSLNSIATVVSHKPRKENVVKREPRADPQKQSFVSSSKIKATADAKTCSPRESASNGGKTLSLNPTRNMSSFLELPASSNIEVPSKGSCTDDEVSSMDKCAMDSGLLVSSSVKSNPVKAKLLNSPSVGTQGKLQTNSDMKTGRKITASNVAAKKTSIHLGAPLSLTNAPRETGNLELTSLQDSRRVDRIVKEPSENNDSDRTLLVIKTGGPENDANANAIPALPLSSSSSPASESSSDNTLHEIIASNKGHIQTVKHRHKTTSRKEGSVSENITQLKPLSVLPQPPDHSRSQTFRFRTARILHKDNDDGPGLPCLKVNLKHHEMQRKKGPQGLFNKVIEETANELVLSKKSKVKALVGAFEVVISLQEGKDSFHNVR